MKPSRLPTLVQRFFTERLTEQVNASPNTIAGYRDTFRLLLMFASGQLGRPPTKLAVEDIDAALVGNFLNYVEADRGNSARSRNTRLAAIRSFFRFVAMLEPDLLRHCQKVLDMPNKRYVKRSIDFLERHEIDAIIAAPDRSTWAGRRDHTLLVLTLQTGLRASELISLRTSDIVLGTGAHIRCQGKGRKERSTPLRRDTARLLQAWLHECRGNETDIVFPTIRGTRMSRDALERLISRHALTAARFCPSLAEKRVSPHVLRHSTAMELLHHGVDQTVIALWLGHESVETTQVYVHADLRLKEKALARMVAPDAKPSRYKPSDKLLAFLETL
ncbi:MULTISPECIES: tyrosine-type recombinase/integrase [Rhizobium/Agrobacterium group]|jgi:site-specific recombinase XerD|uniref:Integrase n=1 Tax=Rhizobium rhizogenes TaxID=359 RepID=A0A546X6A4_RHIRH|nr:MULTISPECIES: tyrosine-type recombinase/integrase [Rhizobium/Agrobacterium group]MCZ7466678.1 tyrosine-type recombinase/integrase [Rhizobium rhizogenes]MCZ7497245.1 tyrosine-type recombinase/integrase [Rhizobium rhizogenes]MDR7147837.1 site-specific recombinase XerD [Rhizobium sp. BE258]TRA96271.1 integrase [Rhizobium rhizogenes]